MFHWVKDSFLKLAVEEIGVVVGLRFLTNSIQLLTLSTSGLAHSIYICTRLASTLLRLNYIRQSQHEIAKWLFSLSGGVARKNGAPKSCSAEAEDKTYWCWPLQTHNIQTWRTLPLNPPLVPQALYCWASQGFVQLGYVSFAVTFIDLSIYK